jgi:hypothetical protein
MTIKNIKRKRFVRNAILSGKLFLRVLGSQKTGFRLAGQRTDNTLFPFGQTFTKQTDAINYGTEKFGYHAKKVVGVTA